MGAFRKWSLPVLLIAAYFVAISALPAQANDVPPSSTNSFYGDATGDMIIAAADIAQMNLWMLGFPYTYDTVQPQTATQEWNTSDVTSDILIAAADLSVINNWMLGFPVSVDDKPWVLSNENLPSSIAIDTPTAFKINLASTLGTAFGRSGLPVIANIDAPNSTATGSLAGRSCSPGTGTRDVQTLPGDQCAISVTVTDWYGSAGPTKGLTETGTYGFSVTGTTTGNLRIIFSISGNPPGLDIPAVTLGVVVEIIGNNPPTFTTTGPTTAIQGVAYTYTPTLTDVDSGETLKCVMGAGDTCGGTLPADTPGGKPHTCTTYTFTPGIGSQSCIVSIRGVDDGVPAASTTQTTTLIIRLYGEWTWMSGWDYWGQSGVYGTKGVPAPTNIPGGREEAVSWTDVSGKLWLFGGNGYASGSKGFLNDLWRWDGTNWTWMSGSSTLNQFGVYGTKGVPAAANHPGARYGSVSWADVTGNFWLFGGYGYVASGSYGWLNDLWRWDGTNWTWMSGSNAVNQLGIYGTKGVPDPANVPGGRRNAVSWQDASGNFWLFGGFGWGVGGANWGDLNDLWRWDGTYWTWISGSNSWGQYCVYGTKGVPQSANVPGARESAVSWRDTTGNLWLFGGMGYSASGNYGYLNDLWRWDGTYWTWMSGSDLLDQNGVYGTKGVPDPANVPGGRWGGCSWTDATGNLWLFGGNLLNDLWRWDGTNWTWMSGSNTGTQYGIYGTKGVPDQANVPGSRYGAVSWKDASNSLWLFGGYGYPGSGSLGDLNDLWRYSP